MSDNRPIGVFDSGVGGLTVLRALQEHLPLESTVYLGDLARCPYGVRPIEQVRRFAEQIGDVLAQDDIKILVIACNTATAAAYDHLRDRYPFPVVGVVDPGASEAVRRTRNGRIGVVATEGTVASGAYRTEIHSRLSTATVLEEAASWLVPLIELGPLTRERSAANLAPLLRRMRQGDVDTLILGCTHFPLIKDIFEDGVGPEIAVVDSAETTAARVARVLRDLDMESNGVAWHRFLVTGPAEAFAERAQAMFRSSPPIETVDLALDYVS